MAFGAGSISARDTSGAALPDRIDKIGITFSAAGLVVSTTSGAVWTTGVCTGAGSDLFFGFLPRGRAGQEKKLAPYAGLPVTLVFFERKDRLADTLGLALRLFGPRDVCLAREMTKPHEQYWNFRLEAPPDMADVRGEATLIIGPPEQPVRLSRAGVEALIAEEQPRGGTPRDVARRVQSRAHGWSGGEIYSILPRVGRKRRAEDSPHGER
jgi:16S rRNA (cytidine1402-2'-O)-methyltransferase